LIEYLKKQDNYLCGAVLGLIAGMGMTVYVDECSEPGYNKIQQPIGLTNA